jgi:galactokinase
MKYVEARDLRQSVTDGFREAFGSEPQRLGRAPGRVNLIGEHTDYNAGLCLPIALAHSTWVAVTPRVDDRVRVVSVQGGSWTGSVADRVGWASYVTGTLGELGVGGADVYVDSDVPLGSGLSSSAALICALCAALGTISVAAAIRAETEGVGARTGGLDQTISMLGQRGEALLLDFRSHDHEPVPWAPESAGLALLVIDTRVSHAHETGEYATRRRECEDAAAALGVRTLRDAMALEVHDPRARHVVTEIRRVEQVVDALAAHNWAEVGRLFTESHESLRDDFEVSCHELDLVVEQALAHGALGARMTGGGFGGSAIALVPSGDLERMATQVAAHFAAEGLTAPQFLVATASAGAELLDR